ncbi:aa3-type cytochrome c oxidase subunit IV [Cribrihabitans pelagius]
MAEHQHGSMDSSVQEKTYASFITFLTRGSIALIVVVLLLAIFAA